MTTINQRQGISASPNSSEEVESHQDTPATKISPFSPGSNVGQLKSVGSGFSRAKLPPQFLLFNPDGEMGSSASLRPQDPFVSAPNLSGTTQASTDISKLSPIASAFTPTTLVEGASGNPGLRDSKAIVSAPAVQDGVQGMLTWSFHRLVSTNGRKAFQQYALAGGPSNNGPYFKMGMFSSETGTSRCIVVSQLAGSPSLIEISKLFGVT